MVAFLSGQSIALCEQRVRPSWVKLFIRLLRRAAISGLLADKRDVFGSIAHVQQLEPQSRILAQLAVQLREHLPHHQKPSQSWKLALTR